MTVTVPCTTCHADRPTEVDPLVQVEGGAAYVIAVAELQHQLDSHLDLIGEPRG